MNLKQLEHMNSEELLKQYRLISKELNYQYNKLQLAETEEEVNSCLLSIGSLEVSYKIVSDRLDNYYS